MTSDIYVEKLGNYHLVFDQSGQIFLPYSLWLNQLSADQVSTFAKRVDAIKRLVRFFKISGVDLARNIHEHGSLMSFDDARNIRNLCFLRADKLTASEEYIRKAYLKIPIHEIEKRKNLIVTRNSASLSAQYIAQFLDFFIKEFARSILPDTGLYSRMKEDTSKILQIICDIRTTNTNHSSEIRSYPLYRFYEIINAIVNKPNEVFVTKKARISQSFKRDQLLVLLAAEGLRRGEIGNLMLKDFIERDNKMYVRICNNLDGRERISTNTARAKNKASGRGVVNNVILLQAATQQVFNEYVESDRKRSIRRFGVKVVEATTGDSWLFANSRGPNALQTASAIDDAFRRAAIGLARLGLLDRASDDPYSFESEKYGCTPHWFRHSAACAFVHAYLKEHPSNKDSENLFALMRLRFGWTRTSEMPIRYAERALQEEANNLVEKVNENILSSVTVSYDQVMI